MTFYLVMNGAGRRPHLEEVDTLEDVQARLEIEDDPNDIVVIEGELVKHQKEEFLFLRDQTIKLEREESQPPAADKLPGWIQAFREEQAADERPDSGEASASTGEAEHPADVEGHAGGEADEASGDGPGEGLDQGGDGEGDGSGTDHDGRPE